MAIYRTGTFVQPASGTLTVNLGFVPSYLYISDITLAGTSGRGAEAVP